MPSVSIGSTPETKGERIVLTHKNIQDVSVEIRKSGCNERFDAGQAVNNVRYENKERGIAFDVPFSSAWGNDRFAVPPFDDYEDELLFGPLVVGEACQLQRGFALKLIQPRSISALSSLLRDEGKQRIQEIEISGMKVVEFKGNEDIYICNQTQFEIVGQKFNYRFISMCVWPDQTARETMLKIIKSAKLTR